MLTKYLVKETSTATPDNKNFAGTVQVAYYGKNQMLIKIETISGTAINDFDPIQKWNIATYGYGRECDAKRSWIYNNPENTKSWSSTVEIVSIEC